LEAIKVTVMLELHCYKLQLNAHTDLHGLVQVTPDWCSTLSVARLWAFHFFEVA